MDYEEILGRYTRIRSVTFEINNTLPTRLPKESIERAAKQLGMWVKRTIVLDHVDQTAILMDYAIHDCRVNGRNALNSYVAEHPPAPQSERETILLAMQRAFYSLFQVEAVVPGVGVYVHDMFLDQRHLMADVGFSQSAVNGIVLATRVFPFGDFLMTSGAPLAPDADTMEAIVRLPPMSRPLRELASLTPEARAELNASIIRLCLEAKNAAQVFYQGIGKDVAEEPVAGLPAHRVGRNEPCPCGSGNKYKRCCGR